MCPDYSDWFGNGVAGVHSRNADRSILAKFLQAHPADYATVKLQVGYINYLICSLYCQFSFAASRFS